MCLLFLAYHQHPDYKVVIAANRDEFLARPTAPLGYLDAQRQVIGGRDLQAHGTWLAAANGRFGAITNYREPGPKKANARSRGEIILSYLNGDAGAEDFVHELRTTAQAYNGFNLLLGDTSGLYYYSNKESQPRVLARGFYGLSNHLLDTPWPKVVRGRELLSFPMTQRSPLDRQSIFAALNDRWQPPPAQLPDTGVGASWERLLAPVFIDAQGYGYGTRSSALLTMDGDGGVIFSEKSYLRDKAGEIETQCRQLVLSG